MEVLQLKKMKAARSPERPESIRLLERAHDCQLLEMLLEEGYRPDRLPDLGTSAIISLTHSMTWDFLDQRLFGNYGERKGIDSSRARDQLKMIHLLVAHGGRWLPSDKRKIGDVRSNFLKMTSDYLLEFVWLMNKYGAARRRDVEELLRTPSVPRLLGQNLAEAAKLAAGVPDEPLLVPGTSPTQPNQPK